MLPVSDRITPLDERYTLRYFTWDDLPALVELMNITLAHDEYGEQALLHEVEMDLRAPGLDAEQDIRLIFTPEGRLIAYSRLEIDTVAHYKAYGDLDVHPEFRGQGLEEHLLTTDDARFLARIGDEYTGEQPLYVQRWTLDGLRHFIDLYEKAGYRYTRTFYRMLKTLDTPLSPTPLPDGYELRPFDRERDGHAVYQAQQEAFRDHWGHTEDVPYEEWAHYRYNALYFNPAMWLIAWKDGEVAGSAICRPFGEDAPGRAWVGTLSVRRPYRKSGLGTALLRQAFYVFQQLGFTEAGLGVDAASKTNAVALYERAGMYVAKHYHNYQKVLRGNPALVKD